MATIVERHQPFAVSKKIPQGKYPAARTRVFEAKENENKDKLVLLHTSNVTNNSQSHTALRIQSLPMEKTNKNVRTVTPAKPKSVKANIELGEPTKVKPAALLYEITERTNQLAQPRTRANQLVGVQQRVDVSRIREAKGRVLELSKPRALPEVAQKPQSYVVPSALTAVATQRILELSRPRRQIRPPSPKKKEYVYESCSPRLNYLSYPRQANLLQSKLKSFLTSNDDRINLDELEQLGNWYSETSKLWESHQEIPYQPRRQQTLKVTSNRGFKRKRVKKNPKDKLRASISNRTVISIDLNPKKSQRVKNAKKLGKSKRRKSRNVVN